MSETPTLKRSITLTQLIFYGLGTMVGAGFYALIGRVAGLAGMTAPVALGFSGLLAFLSAASFAELSSRFPVSAGEVRYVEEGLRIRPLAIGVGWLVILTGVVSAATLSVATVGFLDAMVPVPETAGIIVLVCMMGMVAAWGIGESVAVVFTITVIEIGALVVATGLAADNLSSLFSRWPEFVPSTAAHWSGIFSGSFLAFYAFIGFEDMVNVAEEVQAPRRSLPIALLVSVTLTTILYVVFSVVAVLAVPPAALGSSTSPVALVVSEYGWFAMTAIGLVSILAGINGALVQVVMAARVAYGMASRGQAPHWLAAIHPGTQTPVVATRLITLVIAILATAFPLTTLARTTSFIILMIFTLVNLSLWRIKRSNPDTGGQGPRWPMWLPVVGAGTCAMVLIFQAWTLLEGLR